MPKSILGYAIATTGYHQLWISIVSVAIAIATTAPIALQKSIINDAIEGKEMDLLILLCSALLGVILARSGLKYLLGIYQNWIAQSSIHSERHLLAKAFAGDSKTGESDSGQDNGGQAVSVINNEIEHVGRFVGTGISDLVADGSKLIFAIGYMLWVEPLVALVGAAFLLPQVIIVPLLQKILNRLMRERTDQLRDLSDQVSDLRAGDDLLPEEFDEKLDEIFSNRVQAAAVKYGIKIIVNILNALAPLSVLAFGGYLYIQGDTSLGTIVAFTTGFDRMAGPLRALVNYYRIASVRHQQYGKIVSWKEAALA
ncbi:MAG: ABC transporter ATP-binding protein [Pseudomonadota bacterium]